MRVQAVLLVVAFPLAACSRPTRPLNLVLVSVDTLRADALSCYGGTSVATPSFDRIAREGILFENASTVAPSTLPAHASLLTGETPLRHFVHDNVGFRLRDDVPTLASTLKDAGYRTGGFVGSFVLDRRFGLARGFDVYSDEMPETERGLPERRGGAVLDEALRFMAADSAEPFFAFLHFYDPHRPYDPPAPFDSGAKDERTRYGGEVAYVDSLVGKLLAFLDARGLSQSTVVVVTADHGESLGEHGESTHGFFLYQSTLHVPLLVRGPGLPQGKRVSSLVRIIDVAPTALELLRLPAPAAIEGVSFLGAAGELHDRDVEAYAETFVPRLNHGWSELRSLRRRNWKLILAPRSELYDLDSDPVEQRNRIEEERGPADALEARLGALVQGEIVTPEHVDQKTLASLRALGYLGGAAPLSSAERSSSSPRSLADPKDEIATFNEILDLSVVEKPSPEDTERLAKLLEREPDNPRALAIYGNFLLEERRPAEAQKAFARLVALDPESFDAHYGLGRAFTDRGDIEGALASFEKAREIDPGSANVYSRLAAVEKARGNLDACERWLREAMRVAPSRVGFQDLADLLLASGRASETEKLAGEWKGPGADAATAYARGQLLLSQGNAAEALVELGRADALAPGDDNVEQAVANSLSQLGRFEEAMSHYQAIVSRSPCYLGALTNLGAIYERFGRADDAIRSYENAIRCDDRYPAAYRNLGAALARKGNLREALAVLEKAQSLSPGDRELSSAIAQLREMMR